MAQSLTHDDNKTNQVATRIDKLLKKLSAKHYGTIKRECSYVVIYSIFSSPLKLTKHQSPLKGSYTTCCDNKPVYNIIRHIFIRDYDFNFKFVP